MVLCSSLGGGGNSQSAKKLGIKGKTVFIFFSVGGGYAPRVLSGTLPLPFFQSLLLPVYVVKLGFLLFSNFKSNNDKHKNFRRKFHKFSISFTPCPGSMLYVHSGVSQKNTKL